MPLFARGAGHGSRSWQRILDAIAYSSQDDLLEWADDWRILKQNPAICIKIDHGDATPDATGPFRFALTLHYFGLPIQQVPMGQIDHDLVMPIPQPLNGTLVIDGLGYHLARLFSQREEDVTRFMEKAGIGVVGGQGGRIARPTGGSFGAWRYLKSALSRIRRFRAR